MKTPLKDKREYTSSFIVVVLGFGMFNIL